MSKRDKPEPLWRAKVGDCTVEGYDFRTGKNKTDKPADGEPVFLLCPVCKDEDAPLYPIVQREKSGKTHIIHLMCASDECKGDTIIDVMHGIVSKDVRILEPED